jgi:hypothetical protein
MASAACQNPSLTYMALTARAADFAVNELNRRNLRPDTTTMPTDSEEVRLMNRREAIRRVSAVLGGVAFVGGSGLLTACEKTSVPSRERRESSPPKTSRFSARSRRRFSRRRRRPARAAKTGAFMALMVTDAYAAADQKIFRDGMQKVDDATEKAHAAITADTPAHYFRMMKALAPLGDFTSEIGYAKAMRYAESPGRFDPCVPYMAGEPSWAPTSDAPVIERSRAASGNVRTQIQGFSIHRTESRSGLFVFVFVFVFAEVEVARQVR